MRKGGGFGFVILIVVLAIVLLLVAKQWKAIAPTAVQVTNSEDSRPIVDDHGETEAGEAIRDGHLPNLDEMRQNTAAHSDRLQDALKEIE